jgi:RNA polymerase sigma factor for flagellar operon FliA
MSEEDRATRIVRLFPLVRRLAYQVRVMVPGAEFDDLVGDGTIGLIRAVDTYEHARGASLERYVRQVVIGAMLNGLRKRDPVSERARRTLRRADGEVNIFAHEHGRMPTSAELEVRCQGVLRARQAVHAHTPLSLDAPLPTGTRILEVGNDPAQLIMGAAERAELDGAVEELPARERRLIKLHYTNEIPLRRIGTCMSVSPQRASQLHLAALARLRKKLLP